MKKKIIALLVVFAFIISGCALVDRFEEAKAAYLDSRVEELMAEDAPVEVAPEDAEAEVEEPAEEDEAAAEVTEPAEDAEPKDAGEVEATQEPEPEETPEVEETPDVEETESDTDVDDEQMEEEETIISDDPGIYLGDPDWVDEMEPETEEDYYWNLETDDYLSVAYEAGTLEMTALSKVPGWRIAHTPVLDDAYMEAVVTIGDCSRSDRYGIVFHVPENVGFERGYFFSVTCDGQYGLRIWDGLAGEDGASTWLRYFKSSDYIIPGEGATNVLGIMTAGDTIDLFINGELIESFVDDTYEEGYFGLFVNRDFTENLTINVDRVSYWAKAFD